jgi:hypothetical protein
MKKLANKEKQPFQWIRPALISTFLLMFGANGAAVQVNAEEAQGNNDAKAEAAQGANAIFPGKINLSTTKGQVNSKVTFRVEGLQPNKETSLTWKTVEGVYDLEGVYKFIGASFKEKVIPLKTGKSDGKGVWEGEFLIPKGFGGNHTVYVRQDNQLMAQTNIHVNPTFTMSPASGPVGTEITIKAEGIGSIDMERNWQLTYDNKMTGLISAVTTDGSAVAKIRAAGSVGKHTLTVWHGYLGIPYINHEQAPTSYLPVPIFTFEVTDDKVKIEQRVEPVPKSAAGGGVKMPELKNKPGVTVTLDKASGVVGEKVTMKAQGLPKNQKIDLVWNTMRGSRVTESGFGEKQQPLLSLNTDNQGTFTKIFPVPDDLGGIPHRIDVQVNGENYGQVYLGINPSIVKVSPASGPPGTPFTIEIKGGGWTEYDNSYHITYDNGYVGYACAFNSEGTVIVNLIASGEPGQHVIDFYPGIYRGKQKQPDVYVAPQLTYEQDHPGTSIPAIRLGFEVTKP